MPYAPYSLANREGRVSSAGCCRKCEWRKADQGVIGTEEDGWKAGGSISGDVTPKGKT